MFGYPFGRLIVVLDKVEDRFLSPHPVVIQFIHLASGVVVGTSFSNFIIGMALYYDHGENETAIKLTLVVSSILSVGMYIYIYRYGIYLDSDKYWKDRGKI